MPSANFPKVYVFVSVSPRRAHPGRRPRARWISRSESLVRMERIDPEVGTTEIIRTLRRDGHASRARRRQVAFRTVLSLLLGTLAVVTWSRPARGQDSTAA